MPTLARLSLACLLAFAACSQDIAVSGPLLVVAANDTFAGKLASDVPAPGDAAALPDAAAPTPDAHDATADVAPTCPAGLEQPTVLASLIDGFDPLALAVGPDEVFVGVETQTSTMMDNAILALVPGAKKPQTVVSSGWATVSVGWATGVVTVADGQLIWRGQPPGTTDAIVQVLNLQGGMTDALPNPPGTSFAWDVAANAKGDVLWVAGNTQTPHFALSRWHAGAGAQVLVEAPHMAELFADDGAAYWRDLDAQQNVTFFAYDLATGKQTVVRKTVWADGKLAELRGIDDEALYFADVLMDSGGTVQGNDPVVAWPKTGGGKPLTTYSDLLDVQRLFVVDSTHLYWVAQAAQDRLMRIAKHGKGAPEQVAQVEGHWITAVATDACNIYWATENPPQIWVRRR